MNALVFQNFQMSSFDTVPNILCVKLWSFYKFFLLFFFNFNDRRTRFLLATTNIAQRCCDLLIKWSYFRSLGSWSKSASQINYAFENHLLIIPAVTKDKTSKCENQETVFHNFNNYSTQLVIVWRKCYISERNTIRFQKYVLLQ